MDEEKTKRKLKYVSISEAASICGMHPHTLRRYADENKIKCYKTPAGSRKFDRESLEKYINSTFVVEKEENNNQTNFIYARVSSRKQLDDLERQINYIRNQRPEYSTYKLVSDIASGINFKRKGLETILDACLQRTIGEIIIAHRDRLCRFGFDLIKLFVEKCGGKITILDDEQNKSSEQELAEDLLSIVHVFCCKQMGKRSYETKYSPKSVENQVKTDDKPEENI